MSELSGFSCMQLLCGLATLRARVVIPALVWRELVAPQTLRVSPLIGTARTHATCPKSVPLGAAVIASTHPKVVRSGAPSAGGTVDLWL